MKIQVALENIERLYLDTSPIIYFVEKSPLYHARAKVVIDRVFVGGLEAFTSVVTITEVLTLPLRLEQVALANQYYEMLTRSENLFFIPVSLDIAIRAAELRARYNLRTPDALQLATALLANCDAFLTNDAQLQRVTELPVLTLDALELDDPPSGT